MQTIARQIKFGVKEGNLRYSVVDPILAGGAVTPLYENSEWVPIKPTTDNAFGMALIRWIIENRKYSNDLLSSPNYEASVSKGFNSWTNATHLVIEDQKHPNYRKMLRAEDLGLEVGEEEKDIFIVIDDATKEYARFDNLKTE